MDNNLIGIICALVAMVSWGLGDFLIQKNSRIIGIWKTLFFIGAIGSIGLFPFVLSELLAINSGTVILYPLLGGFITLVASIFDFEALKSGKLAIIEPVLSIEVPFAAIFAVVLWSESISFIGWFLIAAIFLGITVAATQHHSHIHYHKRIFEKGVLYAVVAAITMALTDLLMGVSAQVTSPLLTVWIAWAFFTIVCLLYIVGKGQLKSLIADVQAHPLIILFVGVFDTLGWVAFCFAVEKIPIAITTAISQSYIIITILLGLFVNHERLKKHQIWGVVCATIAVIALAWNTA